MPQLTEVHPNVFMWTDTCNVYVVRDGDAALLIDLGDGSVLDALGQIGVSRVEWVLFTHHHREQCQGAVKLVVWREKGTKTGAPSAERALFEQPLNFRAMRPALSDAFTVHGASYVRPPLAPVTIDRAFARMDDFTWRGREFWCVHAGGHSPGSMAYLWKSGGEWLAFSGDVMRDGAKMQTWYDTEFDYGFAKGLYELANNAAQVAGYQPTLLLPSHGPVVKDATTQLNAYVGKLRTLGELYVRGYEIQRFANSDQDNVSRPSKVPHLWQVTPHLYKFRGPDYWVNFAMLLADSGRAILIDCGLFDRTFLDTALERAKDRLGLKGIDAVFITHMHGDHALDAEHIRQKYGAKLWTLEGIADKFERAWDYDLCAMLPMYTARTNPPPGLLKFDRVLRDGETVQWEGYTLTADWMPGQTKYHACLRGTIDGKTVAFTGDNIFASPTDPKQGGNEAVVARNGGALEEGYLYAADYLHGLGPDLLVGGHCWAMAEPTALIGRMRERMLALREAFRALSAEDDYRYMFDPYWVQALPYRTVVEPGGTAELTVCVRNYLDAEQAYRVDILCPAGLTAEPASVEGKQGASGIVPHRIRIRADAGTAPGLRMVGLDITRNGVRHGMLFDALVHVGPLAAAPAKPASPGTKAGY